MSNLIFMSPLLFGDLLSGMPSPTSTFTYLGETISGISTFIDFPLSVVDEHAGAQQGFVQVHHLWS